MVLMHVLTGGTELGSLLVQHRRMVFVDYRKMLSAIVAAHPDLLSKVSKYIRVDICIRIRIGTDIIVILISCDLDFYVIHVICGCITGTRNAVQYPHDIYCAVWVSPFLVQEFDIKLLAWAHDMYLSRRFGSQFAAFIDVASDESWATADKTTLSNGADAPAPANQNQNQVTPMKRKISEVSDRDASTLRPILKKGRVPAPLPAQELESTDDENTPTENPDNKNDNNNNSNGGGGGSSAQPTTSSDANNNTGQSDDKTSSSDSTGDGNTIAKAERRVTIGAEDEDKPEGQTSSADSTSERRKSVSFSPAPNQEHRVSRWIRRKW